MTWNILNRLKKNYNCMCIGHNYFGETIHPPIKFPNRELNFKLIGTGRAKYSMDVISSEIKKNEIDIFGGLLDTFMLYEAGFLKVDTSPAKTFWYYPSDGGGVLPRNCETILKKVNVPVAMSKFARDQVKKVYNIDSKYIPHAYNQKTFYPLNIEEKQKLRQKWLLMNKFVIGTVARNQGRKMLDKTIKAFALFAKDKPDVVLLMHTDSNDPAQVFDLKALINRFGIRNKVLFTGGSFYRPFSYSEMNDVYNLMDVFFLSTSGEGFGVPIIEAMGCGIPQFVTDYTTTKELVIDNIKTGKAIKLAGEKTDCPYPHTNEILDGTMTGSWDVERGIMSIYDAVKQLNIVYKDKSILETYSKNSLKKAKKYYTWDVVMPMWDKLFKEMLK